MQISFKADKFLVHKAFWDSQITISENSFQSLTVFGRSTDCIIKTIGKINNKLDISSEYLCFHFELRDKLMVNFQVDIDTSTKR